MRVLSVCLACVLAACISNPDPTAPSVHDMQKSRFGGYIEVTHRDGNVLRGELLAIEDNLLWIETVTNRTESVSLREITKADLYKYESDWGIGLWGFVGTVSTISHGVFLIFTGPIWLITSSIVAAAESHHMRLQIPEDNIDEFVKWARYPQGMPKRRPMVKPSMSKSDEAWQLTQQAQQAAREGRCDLVAELDRRVRALDPGIHEVTFLRDEAVRRCFGMPSLLPPSAGSAAPVVAPDAGVTP